MSIHPEVLAAPSTRRLATRVRLLEAAAEVFAEEGLQGAAVEAICSRAGFTRGAFYSNFESKEQLFLELLEREFDRRAARLQTQALALEPELREKALRLSPAEAASYIAEFFAPETDATTWFVLETEFLLLAMRDPSIAPGYHQFMDRFYAGIADVVERIVGAAGRRFSLPVERAMPVLSGVYERALRGAVLARDGGTFDGLGDRLAELLFALTEPLGAGGPAPAEPANPSGWEGFEVELEQRRKELLAQGLPIGNTSGLTMQQILDEQRADRL